MKKDMVDITIREIIFFFASTFIGSVTYYIIDKLLSNSMLSIISAAVVGLSLFLLLVILSSRKKKFTLGVSKIYIDFGRAPSTMEIIKNARNSIEYLGISARTFINSEIIEEVLENKIREGIELKVLILKPDSKYLSIKAIDQGDDPEAWKCDINASLKRMSKLCTGAGTRKVSVRIYDALPIWRGILIDSRRGFITF
ncbi:MAG TPA: hypothetical protein DEO84_12675, partial [candidate division Zixibacteria bacterium]|nr:hypothetical protein [candidate division Zixibacteria bacterium]